MEQAISAYGVAEVVASSDSGFEKGDLVKGFIHWAEYSVVKAEECTLTKLDTLGFPLTYYLGILGELYAGLESNFVRSNIPYKVWKLLSSGRFWACFKILRESLTKTIFVSGGLGPL